MTRIENDNTSSPLVSIIIPSFNSARVIYGALESIYLQPNVLFEVLVMDGKSNDDTAAIVGRFQKKHGNIRFFSEPDKGTFDAMNKGIHHAKGIWLIFLGSDDELHDPAVLQDMSKVLLHNEADVIYGDVITIGDTPFGKHGTTYGGEFSKERIVTRNICHQSIFYRKTVFDKIGNYNLDYPICADWDLNQRCFAYLKPHYVQRTIAKFLAGGLSSGKPDKFSGLERALNSTRYFKISYFNRSFKGDISFFLRLSKHFLRERCYLKAFFYLVIAIYQGRFKLLNRLTATGNVSSEK
jgi:glycosyltransferase involved in cell wall biosynthesis